MSGLAEYVQLAPCPTPAIVQEWDQIPDSLVDSFTPPGFSNRECFSAGQGLGDVLPAWNFTTPQSINSAGTGLGDIALTAPGGYFSSGDFSQWGIAEWGTVLAGVYLLLSLVGDTKRHVRKASKAARAYRSAQ